MSKKTPSATNLNLTIYIGRASDGRWILEITDTDACTEIFRADLNDKQFSDLMSNRQVPFNVNAHVGTLGMKLESKEESVVYSGRYDDKAAMQRALKPHEKEGWQGQVEDLTNHHRSKPNDIHRVRFFRHVPKEKSE